MYIRICVYDMFETFETGADRFLTDIELMLGTRPSNIWKYSWKFVAPVALLVRVKHVERGITLNYFQLHLSIII